MQPTSFRQLQVFIEAIEAGSFRACGDRLGITQAAISIHIRALEDQLGPLFKRRRGSVCGLTESGERCYREIKDMLGRAERLGLNVGQRPGSARRSVMIGAHGLPARMLSRTLPQFVAEHRELNIGLEVMSHDKLLSDISLGRIDLGYTLAYDEAEHPRSVRVCTQPLGLYVSPHHPIAQLPVVSPAELSRCPLIAVPTHTHLRGLLDKALASVGISGCPIAMETDMIDAVREAVLLGIGFACAFRRTFAAAVAAGEMHRVPIDGPRFAIDIRQVSPHRHRQDREVAALADYLAAAVFRGAAVDARRSGGPVRWPVKRVRARAASAASDRPGR
ncbi:MAG: LysR family transcriptional regulator [Gammaproteobacteria bacterium]|nr:LysR family transcriptional regulator [Gammaproteobacteria bacterium]